MYKCLMMILFQDKIIYMPYMPPFARSERIENHASACKPVEWKEETIRSLDRTKLSLCVGRLLNDQSGAENGRDVAICYFQGNGGSLPPRLPLLSSVLKAINAYSASNKNNGKVRYTIYALSYRGYWTSSGRATQSGIEKDAQALLQHLEQNNKSKGGPDIILWGQSIGAGVATTAAATYLNTISNGCSSTKLKVRALVLETPFLSTKNMVLALYPQKWLPYRYLSPFLWNRWDSEAALKTIAGNVKEKPHVLLVPATKDELVPPEEGNKFERLCRELGFDVVRKDVQGALHNETTIRRDGQQAIAKFMAGI